MSTVVFILKCTHSLVSIKLSQQMMYMKEQKPEPSRSVLFKLKSASRSSADLVTVQILTRRTVCGLGLIISSQYPQILIPLSCKWHFERQTDGKVPFQLLLPFSLTHINGFTPSSVVLNIKCENSSITKIGFSYFLRNDCFWPHGKC